MKTIHMHVTTVTLARKYPGILIVSCSSDLSATTRIGCELLLTSNIIPGGPNALRNSEVRCDCQEPQNHSHRAQCCSGRCHAETNDFTAWQCWGREIGLSSSSARPEWICLKYTLLWWSGWSVCALMHLELGIYTRADSATHRLYNARGWECQCLCGNFFELSVITWSY